MHCPLLNVCVLYNSKSQNLAGFTSLAAAAAQAWRGPGATEDLICLCKQGKFIFSFVQAAPKGFKWVKVKPTVHLLDPVIRFLFLLCQFSSWLDFSFKVVVCLPVPCWIKLTPVLQIQGFMSGQKRWSTVNVTSYTSWIMRKPEAFQPRFRAAVLGS